MLPALKRCVVSLDLSFILLVIHPWSWVSQGPLGSLRSVVLCKYTRYFSSLENSSQNLSGSVILGGFSSFYSSFRKENLLALLLDWLASAGAFKVIYSHYAHSYTLPQAPSVGNIHKKDGIVIWSGAVTYCNCYFWKFFFLKSHERGWKSECHE